MTKFSQNGRELIGFSDSYVWYVDHTCIYFTDVDIYLSLLHGGKSQPKFQKSIWGCKGSESEKLL